MVTPPSAEMPFLDHLEELRVRLFKVALALFLGVGVAFALLLTKQVDIVGILAAPIQPFLTRKLIVTHPGDLFDIVMDASIALGLIAASPVIAGRCGASSRRRCTSMSGAWSSPRWWGPHSSSRPGWRWPISTCFPSRSASS